MSEMVDRIAKDAFERWVRSPFTALGVQVIYGTTNITWEQAISADYVPYTVDKFRNDARRAIELMREPTYAMIDNNPYLELSHESVRGCWAWFIEEALK